MAQDAVTLKEKIIKGVLTLATRNFLLNLFAFIANLILTILLTPQIFGIFFLVSAIISFLNYFSDVGLAAALIQRKEEPSKEELTTVFVIQESLVLSIILVIFVFSLPIAQFYRIGSDGVFLLYALLFSFFLASLKTIPSVLLERKLEFGLLSIPQVIENFAYYLVTLLLAYFNFGVYSFAWGAVIRGIVGLIAIYLVIPWIPKMKLSFTALKNLLTFGIPFQTNSLLALVKDDLLTLFLGKMLPLAELGYIGWAKKWAETPLRIIMDSVIRVTFPAFARLQDNREMLRKALEKTIFILGLLIFPATIVLLISIKSLVILIPKYTKWEPAIFSFYLFSITSVMAAFSSPMVNALNSLGKIKSTLILMIMWTLLTWILVPYFVSNFGFNGVAMALTVVSVTSIIPILMMQRLIYFKVLAGLAKPLAVSLLAYIPVYLIVGNTNSFLKLALGLSIGGIAFLMLAFLLMRKEIASFIPQKFQSRLSFFQ